MPVGKDWLVANIGKHRPETLEQAFGRVLYIRRERKGLSQMDLAVASGYSLRYIGDVERGAKSATMRTMNDLATLLDVRLSLLVAEAEESLPSRVKESRRSGRSPR
jgi:transcriptional regulator with XRE-family HTH domain